MDINCSICSDNFNMVSDVRTTLCGHVFHYDCITSWLERSSSCPQCRKHVTVFNLHRIFLNFENENEYHLNRECDSEELLKQLEMLQTENDSLKIKIRTNTENMEELEVINLSLLEMETNISSLDAEQLNKQLQYSLAQNVILETDLKTCKDELNELKMKNLTLTEETLPSAKKLIESLQNQLERLSMNGANIESDDMSSQENSNSSGENIEIHEERLRPCNKFGKRNYRNKKTEFKKQFDNLKKSSFINHNRSITKTPSSSNIDILFGIDSEDEEKVENLIKQIKIQDNSD